MLVERSDHFVDAEPRPVGIGEHARDKRAHPTLLVAGRVGARWRRADERPDSSTRLDHPGPLELCVHTRHRVGVYPKIHGKLSDGRQLIARA